MQLRPAGPNYVSKIVIILNIEIYESKENPLLVEGSITIVFILCFVLDPLSENYDYRYIRNGGNIHILGGKI